MLARSTLGLLLACWLVASAGGEELTSFSRAPSGAAPRESAWPTGEAGVVEMQQPARLAPPGSSDVPLPSFETTSIGFSQPLAAPPVPAPPLLTYPNLKVSGVFQADIGFFSQDADSLRTFNRIQDGGDFRRARLGASGNLTETMNYFFQMDFAFIGRPSFTDVWVEHADLPVLGTFRVGQWKQPFSLEVVSSFRYTTFFERSLLFQPFTPFRHLGMGFQRPNDALTMTFAASAFRSGQDQFGGSVSTAQGWGTAERWTWAPYYDEPARGRYYLHLGVAHYLNAPPHKTVTFRTIPEFFIGENAPGVVGTSGQAIHGGINGTPFFMNTGPLSVRDFNVLGTELLWVAGPCSIQSEAMVNFVDRLDGGNAVFAGAYLQVGYFLTGEHRPYDRRTATIDRVIPFTNFFHVRTSDGVATGWGAWELAVRGSTLQLNDQGVRGGSMTDLTGGVNWYLNPNTKLAFNTIHALLQHPTMGFSQTHMFGLRAQADF